MSWVERQGGHLWLTRHGTPVAAVIPFHEMKVLDAVLGKSETSHVAQVERDYHRFRAAKVVQEAEEIARMVEGKLVGGDDATARKQRMLDQGRDPWKDDPVLITARPHRPALQFATREETGQPDDTGA
ncbi:hypothetical protein ACN2XU_18555 [Primorskyibacter sp. 2E107]|uniref:hypothetical protein n=1 Tax=Primorskyibacter sp. 2E107 TaxID=3403458 RepID=UPI003AF542C8